MILILLISCGSPGAPLVKDTSAGDTAAPKHIGGACDGCELMYEGMPPPQNLLWKTSLVTSDEPGTPMIISGQIFHRDRTTPASNVILYVYQTDATGHYSAAPNQTAARRHGHIRGWMKTDAGGRYEFSTIRPAPYPSLTMPAHIHPVIKEPGTNEYYIDEFQFTDDPLLKTATANKPEGRGGSGLVSLTKDPHGTWRGTRNIILGMAIPNY